MADTQADTQAAVVAAPSVAQTALPGTMTRRPKIDRMPRLAARLRPRFATVFAIAVSLAGMTAIGGSHAPFGTTAAFAQAGGTPPATPDNGGTAGAAYTIGVDDIIDIAVLDHSDVNNHYQVPPDGIIEPAAGGEINVKGMTVKDLRARLTKAFSKRFYNPQVIVNVHPNAQFVNVTGASKGGKIPLRSGERVLDVLVAAGGLPYDRPEDFKATLFRSSTAQAIPINVKQLFENDLTQNVVMENGDTLYVEEKQASETTVQVLGEVQKPGPYPVPRDHSILTVMQGVGGPTPLAALSGVVVEHEGQQTKVDLRNYQKTGFDPAVKIEPGDKLIVPRNNNEYYVIGAGEKTGTMPYPDDKKLTVFTAWTAAGGSTEGVDLTKVALTHTNPDGTTKSTVINLAEENKTHNYTNDPPVEPGDRLYFPPSGNRRGLSAGEVIGLFTGIVGVFYTITQLRHH